MSINQQDITGQDHGNCNTTSDLVYPGSSTFLCVFLLLMPEANRPEHLIEILDYTTLHQERDTS